MSYGFVAPSELGARTRFFFVTGLRRGDSEARALLERSEVAKASDYEAAWRGLRDLLAEESAERGWQVHERPEIHVTRPARD